MVLRRLPFSIAVRWGGNSPRRARLASRCASIPGRHFGAPLNVETLCWFKYLTICHWPCPDAAILKTRSITLTRLLLATKRLSSPLPTSVNHFGHSEVIGTWCSLAFFRL